MVRKGKDDESTLVTVLLIATVISSLLVLSQTTTFSYASPNTSYFISVSPARIQEGLNTNITVSLREASVNTTYTLKVNVTAPEGISSSAVNITVATDEVGVGSNLTKFWSSFTGANTDFVGTYNVTLSNIAGNETYATTNFEVSLADKSEYVRTENVSIRGSGYDSGETVFVDLKFGNVSVSGFPRPINASTEGVVIDSWVIPSDASLGVYNITLSNATTTVKPVPDAQLFTVEGICEVQTRNLADEPLANVTVEVHNSTSDEFLNFSQETNETGWARFLLEAGNYTFKAFWRNVEVSAVNQNITDNVQLQLQVSLSHLKLAVKDETETPIPLTDLRLRYNYTTRDNNTISETSSFTTGVNGTVALQNTFTNISYIIEARRYGFLFNTTLIENLPAQAWNNITIIAPTYTVTVQVLDSKNAPATGFNVAAYEWSSGTTQPSQTQTSTDGIVVFSLTFGKYRLRAFADSLVLNETALDLIEDNLNFTFHLTTLNVDVTVRVRDYFGQPIANANVTIERKTSQEYTFAYSQFTGADGSTTFSSKIGGDSRILVYKDGKLVAAKTQFLSGDKGSVEFQIAELVAILGYLIPTGLFALLIFLLILAMIILLLSRGHLMKDLRKKRKK